MTPSPALTRPAPPDRPDHAEGRLVVVTRHPGAADWVQSLLRQPVQVVSHLHEHAIEPGVRYVGVFPLNLAAAICAAGAECWAISLQLPPELRGQELSAAQLDALGARLVRYQVSEIAAPLCHGGSPQLAPEQRVGHQIGRHKKQHCQRSPTAE